MSGYGKVIDGGARMTKGLTKGINDKLDSKASEEKRRASVADRVKTIYDVKTLSEPHLNNINGGSFTKAKQVKNV